jgi:hypothetical protein
VISKVKFFTDKKWNHKTLLIGLPLSPSGRGASASWHFPLFFPPSPQPSPANPGQTPGHAMSYYDIACRIFLAVAPPPGIFNSTRFSYPLPDRQNNPSCPENVLLSTDKYIIIKSGASGRIIKTRNRGQPPFILSIVTFIASLVRLTLPLYLPTRR